jgi:two-component system sensor histidine kinase RegB
MVDISQLKIIRSPVDRMIFNALWLLKLRWVAVIGQFITIVVATWFLKVPIPLTPLIAVLLFTAGSNLVMLLSKKRFLRYLRSHESAHVGESWLALIMYIDLLSLTILIYYSGGPTNPFSIFYIVNLSLAAILLPPRWVIWLTFLTIGSFAGLFLSYHPIDKLNPSHPFQPYLVSRNLEIIQIGLFVAFAACCIVLVYFFTRLSSDLRQREIALREADDLHARSEKLEALGTLAAGAAHELASPLATIAIVSKELERNIQLKQGDEAFTEDVILIREEIDRCRSILNRLSMDTGHATGEQLVEIDAEEIIDIVLQELRSHEQVSVTYENQSQEAGVIIPLHSVTQSVRGLVQNAMDASGDKEVKCIVATTEDLLKITIEDQGIGMPPEVLARAGDPFFTTKEPGEGMGLGIFLARSVFERLHGKIEIDSVPGEGTTVSLYLPLITE